MTNEIDPPPVGSSEAARRSRVEAERETAGSVPTGGNVVTVTPGPAGFDGDRWRCMSRVAGPAGGEPRAVAVADLTATVARRVGPRSNVVVRWPGGRAHRDGVLVATVEGACRVAVRGRDARLVVLDGDPDAAARGR